MLRENNSTKLMEELNEFSENISEGISEDDISVFDEEIEFSADSDIEELNPDVFDDHYDLVDINDELVEFDSSDFIEEEYSAHSHELTADPENDDFSADGEIGQDNNIDDVPGNAASNRIFSIEESDGSELEEEEVDLEEFVREVDLLSDFRAAAVVEKSAPKREEIPAETASLKKNDADPDISDDDNDFILTHVEGFDGVGLSEFIDHVISENKLPSGSHIAGPFEKLSSNEPSEHMDGADISDITSIMTEEGIQNGIVDFEHDLPEINESEVVFEDVDRDLNQKLSFKDKAEVFRDKIVIDIPDSLSSRLPDGFFLEPIDLSEAQMIANEDILLLDENDLIQELDAIHLKPLDINDSSKSGIHHAGKRSADVKSEIPGSILQEKSEEPEVISFKEDEPADANPEIAKQQRTVDYLGDSADHLNEADENFILENSESDRISVITDSVIEKSELADKHSEEDDSDILFEDVSHAKHAEEAEPGIIDITSQVVILDDENVDSFLLNNIDSGKQKDMKKLLSYLDGLFENLPEELIKKFAESEYFDLYVKIMNDLGV